MDFFRYAVPAVLFFTGLMASTQKFAHMMNGDTRIIGKAWFTIPGIGYAVYNPIFYICCFPKYIFRKEFQPYLVGSSGYFLVFGLISLLTILIWGAVRQIYAHIRNIHGTARLAGRRDLWKNGLLHREGVICGELDSAKVIANRASDTALHLKLIHPSHLICHTGKANTLLLAMTGDGKGVSFLIPTMLSYKGSMIIYDPKGENYNITAGWRRRFSHIIKFAPCSRMTIRFNPVMAIRDGDEVAYRDANLIADILFAPSKAGGAQNDTEQYFANSAKDMTTTAILHVRFCDDCKDKSLAGVLKLLTYTDYRTLIEKKSGDEGNSEQGKAQFMSMITAKHYYRLFDNKKRCFRKVEAAALHGIIADGAMRLINTNPKEKASVFKTVFSKLQLFEDPLIAASTSGNDFEIEDFINSREPVSMYLTVPYSDVQRISPVFRLLISFMLKKFSEGETQYGAVKLKNHLLFLLDEFPTLGAFPDIAQNMGVLRGYGVNFFIVCQSLKQLTDVYGPNHPFLDHCAVRIVCAPNSVSDAKEFCDAIGNESIMQAKISRSGGLFAPSGNLNFSDNDMARTLLDPSDLMRLPGDKCLVMAHSMQPYIADKVVYYDDKRFNSRLSYKAPSDMAELYSEIAGLPSRRRLRKQTQLQLPVPDMHVIEEAGTDGRGLETDDEEEGYLAVIDGMNEGKQDAENMTAFEKAAMEM